MKQPYSDQVQLEKKKQEDFMNILLPEINSKSLVKKIAVDIPPIGGVATAPVNSIDSISGDVITPEPITPVNNDKSTDKDYVAIFKKVEDLQRIIDSLMFEQRLKDISDMILQKVDNMLFDIRKKIDDLYDKKVPQRTLFNTEGAYTSQLFTLVSEVLDRTIPQVYDDVARYSLLSTQVSSVYDDGTVENALVAVSVTLSFDGNRYDFKADIPILGGVIQTPFYIERGRRLIPLTESALRKELESFSYRKMDVDKPMEKPNLYSNVGANPLKREDTQKFYEVQDNVSQSEFPHDSRWDVSPDARGRI